MATAVHLPSLARDRFGPPTSPSWPGLATGVLDLLREAVFVLADDARLIGANRAAGALLREGDGLALSASRVVASTAHATHALRSSVEHAALGKAARVQVPRAGRTPLTLWVEPHPEELAGAAAAVVFATDEAVRTPRSVTLAAHYGLTPTEACVAQRLAGGADLERIAHELRITVNTVRGHLKQIFGKTRTHRQAELVCKLLSEA